MFKGNFANGTVEGTGAAITVQLGFKPRYVKITNVDGLATLEWNAAVPGSSVKAVTAGTISAITTTGVALYEGTRGENTYGFTLGTDADVNASGETLTYIAFGED